MSETIEQLEQRHAAERAAHERQVLAPQADAAVSERMAGALGRAVDAFKHKSGSFGPREHEALMFGSDDYALVVSQHLNPVAIDARPGTPEYAAQLARVADSARIMHKDKVPAGLVPITDLASARAHFEAIERAVQTGRLAAQESAAAGYASPEADPDFLLRGRDPSGVAVVTDADGKRRCVLVERPISREKAADLLAAEFPGILAGFSERDRTILGDVVKRYSRELHEDSEAGIQAEVAARYVAAIRVAVPGPDGNPHPHCYLAEWSPTQPYPTQDTHPGSTVLRGDALLKLARQRARIRHQYGVEPAQIAELAPSPFGDASEEAVTVNLPVPGSRS